MESSSATAEQNILGLMCQDSTWETLHNGVEELEQRDFADKECLSVFDALTEIVKCGGVPTVSELCTKCPEMNREEVLNYFTEYGSFGSGMYEQYKREIRRSLVNRTINAKLAVIQNKASNDLDGAAELLQALAEEVQRIDTGNESLTLTEDELMDAMLSIGEKTDKVRTGFSDIDKILSGGYGRGTLNAIGGRPSMGKSTLAMNIAMNVLLENGGKNVVAYFTLEESVKAFMRRVLLHLARCGAEDIVNGDPKAANRVLQAQETISAAKDRLMVAHLPGVKVGKLTAICRKLKASKKHIELIVIDYLTLMDTNTGKNKPLNQVIGEITKSLKALASEMNAPVLLLCQLNRDSEREGEPGMASFKDSGNIEQDVDTAIALYRPKSEDVPDEWMDGEADRRIPPNAKIVKNRDGGYGTVQLAWMPKSYTFSCLYRGNGEKEEREEA